MVEDRGWEREVMEQEIEGRKEEIVAVMDGRYRDYMLPDFLILQNGMLQCL
jgi:hypothetical protein